MYCLECARAGARAGASADPMAVLLALRDLGARGDASARRLFFGILWDEGRSILCYRCKRGRPVRIGPEQVGELSEGMPARPLPARTPATAVGLALLQPPYSRSLPMSERE